MPLKVNVEKKKHDIFVVSPEGSIDSETYLDLENKLRPVIEASPKVIIFDMKLVEYISSMGIGVILTTKKAMDKSGGTAIMVNVQPQIKKVFEVVRALPGFNVFASIEEADNYLIRLQQQEMEKEKFS